MGRENHAVAITAAASYVPEKVVTNDELAQLMDTSDEWIVAHTGIKTRRYAIGENTSHLCTKVGQKLLKNAQMTADAIDLIVVATITPDGLTPATAALVQANLGANNAFAFDVSAACSGFVYALSIAHKFLVAGQARSAMVIAAETNSKMLDFSDRTSAVFFGDGAGGVILQADTDLPNMVLGEKLVTKGDGNVIHSGRVQPLSKVAADNYPHTDAFFQDGHAVYDFVTTTIPNHIRDFLDEHHQPKAQIDYVIAHQANLRLLEYLSDDLGIGMDHFVINVDRLGNTSSAGIAIGLAELLASGKRPNRVLLTGFGAGLAYGSMLLDLSGTPK